MPKEVPGFRDNLERLDAAFPGRELVKKVELAGWLGISTKQMSRMFELPPGQLVTKVAIARELAKA